MKLKETLIRGTFDLPNFIFVMFFHSMIDTLSDTALFFTSVLRARFSIMEEIHKRHNIVLDSITQDEDDTFTQGTAASRSTIFTTATSNSNAITPEDMDAFNRALDAKNSELRYKFENTKKQHRMDEDAMQREILELQAKKAAIDNGEIPSRVPKNHPIRI